MEKEIFEGPARNFFVVPFLQGAAAAAKPSRNPGATWGPTHFEPTHGVARANCLCPSIPQSEK
jgi:hypothetical protein